MTTNQNLLDFKSLIERTLDNWEAWGTYENTDVLVSTDNFSNTENAVFYEVEMSANASIRHIFHFSISNDEKYFWINLELIDDTEGVLYRDFHRIFFEFPIREGYYLKPHSLFCDWFDGTYNSLISGSQN